MTTIHLTAEIDENMAGMRLDQALAKQFPQHSRARLQQWIRDGLVKVDGTVLRPRDKVGGGQHVEINATLSEQAIAEPQPIHLDIIYEDSDILVINKPAGLVVHPGAGNFDGTLLNALLHHRPDVAILPRGGIVHRLDKDTTGVMVVALSLTAHTSLVTQLQDRKMTREYDTIVQGQIISGSDIDAPIGRHPTQRIKMAVVPRGKPAVTHYRVTTRYTGHTRLRVKLETGRTHQIRVHMAHIHHPVVGDQIYGGRPSLPSGGSDELRAFLQTFKRQALHATQLTLTHPASGETMSWEAPLPDDMQDLIDHLAQTAT